MIKGKTYKYIDGKVQEVKKDDGINWSKLELGKKDKEYIKQMEELLKRRHMTKENEDNG